VGESLAPGDDDAIPDGDRKLPARRDAIPDGDRKLPARRDVTSKLLPVIPENTRDDDDLQLFMSSSGDVSESEYDNFRADYVLDPTSGKFQHARYSSEDEDYDDAYDDIATVDGGGEDADGDDDNDDEDEDDGDKDDDGCVDDGGDDDDGGKDDGDDDNGDKNDKNNVARHSSPFDPSSLFLHAEEDVSSMLSFFADDANYEEEPREPSVNINNE
jgi:hypothetical protein